MKDIHDRLNELEQRMAALENTVGKAPEENPHRTEWPQDRAGQAEDRPADDNEKVDKEEAEPVE